MANGMVAEASLAKYVDNIDLDDPEFQRQLRRPAVIKEDVNLMLQRQRVNMILQSKAFRRELEEIINAHRRATATPGMNSSLLSLQHLADLFVPAPGKQPLTGGGFSKASQNGGLIPINDLRGVESSMYTRRERIIRCKLASIYRLIDLFGWNTGIYNHATARLSRHDEHFLINPFGLLYHEVTASSLIKIDSQGQVLDPGSTVLGVEQAGWFLHSSVHMARPDIRCIIHIDTPATIAVSCMKTGLLPLSHEAMIIGEAAYYTPGTHAGFASDTETVSVSEANAERAAISDILGPNAHVLFIRSRGLLALGETVEEAWHYATNAVIACETQLRLASLGADHLIMPSEKVRQRAYDAWRTTEMGGISGTEAALAIRIAHARSTSPRREGSKDGYLSDSSLPPASKRPWRLGELEFEALMRHLDNAGFRTGYLYRQEPVSSPQLGRRTLDRSGACSSRSTKHEDVEIPPYTSSAMTTMLNVYEDGIFSGDESEIPGPGTLRHQFADNQWFNTPNHYTKVSTLPDRGSTSHWISNREATQLAVHSEFPPPTPHRPLTAAAVPLGATGGVSKTASSLSPYSVTAPQGSDPKEYKSQQKKVKAKYYKDTNTAGPQSRLLDGLTWDEVRRIRDEGLTKALGPGAVSADTTDTHCHVAAASKAILHRDVRNIAVVYDGVFVNHNPFEKVTDEDLDAYRRHIEMKKDPNYRGNLSGFSETDDVGDGVVAPAAGEHDLSYISATEESVPILASSMISGHPLHEGIASTSRPADTSETPRATSPGSLLSPAAAGATITSETSGTEDTQGTEKKKKKKRLFQLPSFAKKSKGKDKTLEK